MEDPEEGVIPATIPKNSSTEGKAVEDPPGWAVPVNRARHLEWWAHPEYQQQTQQKQRTQPQHESQPIPDIESPQIPQQQGQTLHRYDDYLKANGNEENNANDDDTFSWVPPPPVGASNRSPDGWALTFRTLEAKRIFESAVPQRSWSVDSDKNDKPLHSEQTVITDFTHNSWMMERPPPETEESMDKDAPKRQSQIEGEEEIVEEEVVDEETYHSGTMEEVIDEEEIIEEEIIVEDDDDDDDEEDIEEIVDEEILEQVMVASASESYTVSTFSSQSKPQHPPPSNRSQPTMPVRSSSPSSFVPLPPKSEKEAKPPRRRGDPKSTKGAKTKTTKMAPPRKKIAQRAPDSVASSTHHSVPTPSKKKPISQSSSSSSSSRRPNDDEVTEDSGSTQILYIRDPHDLQEIVEKCFNGNVRIEDEVPTVAAREEDDYCAPTQFQLGLMIVLIILISMAIVVGLMVYFK